MTGQWYVKEVRGGLAQGDRLVAAAACVDSNKEAVRTNAARRRFLIDGAIVCGAPNGALTAG